MKGEFENRLKQVIEEVQSSEKPIILFIDEAHTLIGAGGTAGQGDAANLLKPALARGTLRTVAAGAGGSTIPCSSASRSESEATFARHAEALACRSSAAASAALALARATDACDGVLPWPASPLGAGFVYANRQQERRGP